MTFTKNFPKQIKGSPYTQWEEVSLTQQEELEEDQNCRLQNIKLMKECIEDAGIIMKDKTMKSFQSNLVDLAIALFEKRASHSVYYKEKRAKKKFDEAATH